VLNLFGVSKSVFGKQYLYGSESSYTCSTYYIIERKS
jgi:hypothetical protein